MKLLEKGTFVVASGNITENACKVLMIGGYAVCKRHFEQLKTEPEHSRSVFMSMIVDDWTT